AKLVESTVFARLVDAPLDLILALELSGFGADEAEHHGLALRHRAQRTEIAGARRVVFQEIAVDFDRIEQLLGNEAVAALSHPCALEVAAAEVDPDPHIGRTLGDRAIDQP